MQKKKVLFVIDSMKCGGAEKSLVALLNNLDSSKLFIELLMFKRGGEFEKLLPQFVHIIDAPYYYEQLQKRKRIRLRDLYFRIKTSLLLRINLYRGEKYHSEQVVYKSICKNLEYLEECYDYAVAYSQGMPTYYVANHVKAKRKAAWINCNYVATKYNKLYDQNFYQKFQRIITVSEFVKETLISYSFYSRIRVIHDIVDPKIINILADNEEDYKGEMNENVLRLLTVARLEKIKGYDLLVKAAYILKEQGYEFCWYIIGDGILKKEISEYCRRYGVEEYVHLLGFKSNPYVYMKKCDIYVQTSRNEGLGLTVIEAKILEKLIVCTNFSTASSIINDNQDGMLCGIDAKKIADAIMILIKNKQKADKIQNTLKKETKFDTTGEVEKVYLLFKNQL